ncbi:hypothetical protein K402DRAFT_400517 [Aulographum hederae CBS 113979]|uniref:SEC7 domain-containing protein n=1 Tax=Aulographum hederae CBS 113979 TaxID=1176131 RepID=A0A6G1HDC5_9PEZI|nr:hypothetical protein K402DRAFT_400517 [Aulographum hederae CBS 113979]
MPLKGLRPNKSERDLRRRRTLDFSTFSTKPPRDPSPQRPARASDTIPETRQRQRHSEDGSQTDGAIHRMSAFIGTPTSSLVTPPAPPSPSHTEEHSDNRRFSNMWRFRNASDSQLSKRVPENGASEIPPVPALPAVAPDPHPQPAPKIITTAPTLEAPARNERRKSKFLQFGKQKTPDDIEEGENTPKRAPSDIRPKMNNRRSGLGSFRAGGKKLSIDESARQSMDERLSAPPSRGEQSSQRLAPPSRYSESSRSDRTSEDHPQRTSTPTPGTSHKESRFSWHPRRNKNRNSLFPLPVKISPPEFPNTAPTTPRGSTSALNSESPSDSAGPYSSPRTAIHRAHTASDAINGSPTLLHSSTHAALAGSSISFAAPGTSALTRKRSSASTRSSALNMPLRDRLRRTRSSTVGSSDAHPDDTPPTPSLHGGVSGRTSTSTAGRSSFTNLFGLSNRFRHGSEPHSPRHGSPGRTNSGTPGPGSQSNSLSLSREVFVLPDREEGESPVKYLERVEETVDRSQIPSLLCKTNDSFSEAVMRSYMRKFAFFGDPLDMCMRKLLMDVDLPKETQHIDRVIEAFANRYDECNPGIFITAENAYFTAFSILVLQTDLFNRNNKRKMTRTQYLKTVAEPAHTSTEVLGCFYDNIIYTPFIRVEDEPDLKNSHRKAKKILSKPTAVSETIKKSREPVDPYTLIFENKLDVLRPPIREVVAMEDPYNYTGTSKGFDIKFLMRTSKSGIIQIESARSRPDAFMTPSTTDTPEEAKVGLVDLPVDKVGVLWRKDPKRKAGRSPWQEWGAVLTGSGLSFFRNVGWVKNLIHQYDQHLKSGNSGVPVVFRPAVQMFKADYFLPTEKGVALQDTMYRKHKNAFTFFSGHGSEEIFLADNETELNDWMAKLNHQAAFRTAGVHPRGLIGGNYEGQRRRGMRRLESATSARTVQTPTGEVTIQSGKIDHQLAQQISAARMEEMQQKILDTETKIATIIQELDEELRNARHLLVLAPIQAKTREQIVLAAGAINARLKWVRTEMWRNKCHRDILAMDLEDERKTLADKQARIDRIRGSATSPVSSTTQNGVHRLNSIASSIASPKPMPQSPKITEERPSTASSVDSDVDEDEFTTPPETTPEHSPKQVKPLLSPLHISTRSNKSPILSPFMPHTPRYDQDNLTHRSSISSATGRASETRSEYTTPMLVGDDEAEAIRESSPGFTLDGARPETPVSEDDGDANPTPTPGSPDSKVKVRRSLHRTLRDGRHGDSPMSHRTSRKFKDSTSSAGTSEKNADNEDGEGLTRAKGSFTVHGKKASVVTFGSEWQNMSAEERFKLRKQAHTGANDSNSNITSAVDDNLASSSVPHLPSIHHHGNSASSIGSSSTATTSPGLKQERSSSLASVAETPREMPRKMPPLALRERRQKKMEALSRSHTAESLPALANSPPESIMGSRTDDEHSSLMPNGLSTDGAGEHEELEHGGNLDRAVTTQPQAVEA